MKALRKLSERHTDPPKRKRRPLGKGGVSRNILWSGEEGNCASHHNEQCPNVIGDARVALVDAEPSAFHDLLVDAAECLCAAGFVDEGASLLALLVAMADEGAGDVDLEDEPDEGGHDDEPTLGRPESLNQTWALPSTGQWDDGLELDDSDKEPSLGSIGSYCGNSLTSSQTAWACGARDERELDPADDEPSLCGLGVSSGDDADRKGDDADREPTLGATEALSHVLAWSWPKATVTTHLDGELEADTDDEDGHDAEDDGGRP